MRERRFQADRHLVAWKNGHETLKSFTVGGERLPMKLIEGERMKIHEPHSG